MALRSENTKMQKYAYFLIFVKRTLKNLYVKKLYVYVHMSGILEVIDKNMEPYMFDEDRNCKK